MIETRPHHIGISVESMDRSKAFYKDLLGFEQRSETYIPERKLKIVYIAGNGYELELFEQEGSQPLRPEEKETGPSFQFRGFRHLAFEVDDVDATWEELQSNGHDLVVPPTSNTDLGVRYCFIRDPDGHLLEFLTPI